MIRFFNVDPKYADYLRSHDQQIPYIEYEKNNKFLCGVVMGINGHSYYAPVSSFSKQQKTNYVIKDSNGKPISSIRFCFMFPAMPSVLNELNINSIPTFKHSNFVNIEYFYCARHEQDILKSAERVYYMGCDRTLWDSRHCCDFQRLEEVYKDYK